MQNNRRVNQQKKEAIEEGRKRLGVRGRGKGIALQQASGSDVQSEADEDELSTRDASSERDSEYAAPLRNLRPRRAATKRQYVPAPDEEDAEDSVEAPTPPKKTKRNPHRRSQSAVENLGSSPQQPGLNGSSNDAFKSSPPSLQQNAYAPTAVRHSTESSFNPGYPSVHYSNGFPLHHNPQYVYNGLPANRYGHMDPMHIVGGPTFSHGYDSQGPQSHSPTTYSENVSPAEISPIEAKYYDPYVS